MQADVAVAEPEPAGAAERDRRLERVPALVRATPTPLLVGETRKRVEDAVEVRRDVEAEDLEVVADVPDHGELGGVDHVDEPAKEARAAHPAAEDGDLHRAACGQCPRSDTKLEPFEVGHRVDVVGEVRDRRGDHVGADRVRVHAEARGAPRAVERCEERRRGEAERVRRPVTRRDVREPVLGRRRLERAQVARDDARDVCVHDEHRTDDVAERGGDGCPLAAAGVAQDLRVVLGSDPGSLVVGRHDDRRSHTAAGGEDVGEHGEAERLALVVGEGAEPLLATRPAEGNDDRGHRSWTLSAWRTQRSQRSSKRSPRCSN